MSVCVCVCVRACVRVCVLGLVTAKIPLNTQLGHFGMFCMTEKEPLKFKQIKSGIIYFEQKAPGGM